MELTKEMSQEQKRTAVREAVERIAKGDLTKAESVEGGQLSQAASRYPLTEKAGRTFATEEGTEAGLVWDEYVEKRLRPETADRINTIARELGVPGAVRKKHPGTDLQADGGGGSERPRQRKASC